MAVQQLTLNQTVKLIRDIALSHNQINTVYFGDVWEFLAQTDNTYPAMFYSLTGSSISGKTLGMDFSLFFLDRQLQDETNETDVLSDQLLIAQDIFAMMRYPKFDWKIDENVNIEFFTENEKDYLSGVKIDITINYPMLTDRCQVPSNYTYPDFIGTGNGSMGSINYIKFLLDYATLSNFPSTGEVGKIYVANDTNKIYRFVDTIYVEISPTTATSWGSIIGTLSNQTDLQTVLNLKENSANKGAVNGYASLDGSGLVPSSQLPSYVDDVLEYANLASFPTTGTTGKIYVALDTNKIYRWSGSTYIEVSPTVGTTWGGISGILSNQTDLQAVLNALVPYTGATQTLNLGAKNIIANAIFNGLTEVAASGTQIVLTIDSTPIYLISGSGGQTIKLPDATTLRNGTIFSFNNNQSSGVILVNNNSNTLVKSVPSGGYLTLVLLTNINAAGTWDAHFQSPSNVSWSTNTFDYTGSFVNGTWNGNVVQPNRGGTGQSTYTDGQLLIGNTSGNTLSKALLTAGAGINIANGNGSITISSTITQGIIYKLRSTYALMIADGTPTINTIYTITNDENKSYVRSTYLWKSDGNREWIATTPDN